jgi:hypothetical protein
MQNLTEELNRTKADLVNARQELAEERRLNATLRQAIAELAIEVEQFREDGANTGNIVSGTTA